MSILGALEREGQHALVNGLGKGPPPPQKTKARFRRPFLLVVDSDRVDNHRKLLISSRKLLSLRITAKSQTS